MDDRSKLMLTAPPIPLLVKMSAPNSLASLIQASVSMAEIWFIGRLGSLSLAAIALVFPLLMLTQALSGGAMGGAVASAIARALGAGNLARAENLIWHAIALAGAGSLLLLALFLLVGDRFLGFMGGTGEILEQAVGSSLILFAGGICLWLVGVVSAVFRGMGNMRFPAAMMALSAILQIPLSGAMILGAFGFPGLGIRGAAISAIVSALLLSAAAEEPARTLNPATGKRPYPSPRGASRYQVPSQGENLNFKWLRMMFPAGPPKPNSPTGRGNLDFKWFRMVLSSDVSGPNFLTGRRNLHSKWLRVMFLGGPPRRNSLTRSGNLDFKWLFYIKKVG